jgi:hypothetical protein
MENFTYNMLSIAVHENSGHVTLAWLGKSIERDPGQKLNPYLQTAINEIIGRDAAVDFSGLEYLNSRTIPPIIHFIKGLDAKNIKTTIYYNRDSRWQELMFKSVHTIAQSMKNVTVVGKAIADGA